jgi:hypothetical protein
VGTNSLWLGPGNITDPLNNFMYAKPHHYQLAANMKFNLSPTSRYEMHQFFDGQGGTTVCQPDINVDALFGGVTQWARSLGVYAPSHHHIIVHSVSCLMQLLAVRCSWVRSASTTRIYACRCSTGS